VFFSRTGQNALLCYLERIPNTFLPQKNNNCKARNVQNTLEHGFAEKSANPAIRDHPYPQRCCRPLAPELWMGFEMSSSGDPFMSHLFE
jgi:hypothetical protein